jgi:hypothetical protein
MRIFWRLLIGYWGAFFLLTLALLGWSIWSLRPKPTTYHYKDCGDGVVEVEKKSRTYRFYRRLECWSFGSGYSGCNRNAWVQTNVKKLAFGPIAVQDVNEISYRPSR